MTCFFFLLILCRDNIGETVIFQWIERAREWLQDKASVQSVEMDNTSPGTSDEVAEDFSEDCNNWSREHFLKEHKETNNVKSGPPVTHGDPISFKKSTFQGHVATVTSVNEVKYV